MEGVGTQFPKLPELDKEDIKAVRSFLPGKLLSRSAALLALVMLVLGFAGVVDQGLKRLLGVDLSSTPRLHYGLLFGLPLLVVASQLIVEWRAEYRRQILQRLAIQTGDEQSGYFRIGPYQNTIDDRAKFSRADRAHEKVLGWIEGSSGVTLLYLTGDSGSGKSSLLNAFVFPSLQDHGWTVVEARAWPAPETALRKALTQVLSARRSRHGESEELRRVLAAAVRATGTHLLLVLDQFEEFLILGEQEQQEKFTALIASAISAPIQGLSLLLVLRSDYQTLLDDAGLPPSRYGENFFQVGRFTIAAATNFMTRSGLNLHPDTLDRLLTSAAELDDTPGLVRPITLNVIGYVLATGKAVAMSADAGELVRRYIELTVGQPAIRDFALRVLEQLVTEQGTKRPRSEQELADSTGLHRGEIRAVMNGLGDAALARPLDPGEGVWELSHDFIARAVTRFLGRRRHELLQRAAFYTAPALLLVMLLAGASRIAWDRFSPYEIRNELGELGLSVHTTADGGLIAERNSNLTPKTFLSTPSLLAKLPIRSLNLSGVHVDLALLKGFTKLQSLNLSGTQVNNIEPLKSLTALQSLDLSGTQVNNIEPLRGLTALQSLILSFAPVYNLEPLKGLTALQSLNLMGMPVDNLEPLRNLTALQSLNLQGTRVNNLEPLRDLTALRSLNLLRTNVNNLEGLRSLTALRTLYLSFTPVNNIEPLKDLTALQILDLSGTKVNNLEPLRELTELQVLVLSMTRINNLEPLRDLISLRSLYLSETPVNDLEPLKGLTALQFLDLSKTQINNLKPLKHLTALQSINLLGTNVNNLDPLKDIPALQISR